ncbi:TonB-dependent receptor plug domain-containing protein [Methylococcus capsulatus]|jgi:outer membrane cobalamin receptor|uniref:Iron complex outermembrane recepter protein n=1 Tax=Methylococcus capsulatus TaxID=414 RepID=A0AA35UDU3_METCP|nr:TonB-dependent receptor [Methylococcus capsulatus]CAI8813364.1 iron complex outermembrane recepter protein [Methylococcus capsulatus]
MHHSDHRNRRLAWAAALWLAAAGAVSAGRAEQAPGDADMEGELKFLEAERDTLVTASRTKERTDESIATSTVITQDQIRRMGARTLSDALRIVPGIGITQTEFGIGAIDVRGVRTSFSDKVLMLLNGHPLDQDMANPGSTWVYDDLAVDTIKRIEVVRGSASALYGANAMMAVINIITQDAKDTHGVRASAGYGNYDTQQYRLSAGQRFDNGEAVVHFNYRGTNGLPRNAGGTQRAVTGPEKRYDLEWQLGYEGFKLDGRYIGKRLDPYVSPFDLNAVTQNSQYDNYFLRLSRDWTVREDLSLSTQLYYDSFDSSYTGTAGAGSRLNPLIASWGGGSNDSRTGGEVQANYRVSRNNSLIGGVALAREAYDNPSYRQTVPYNPDFNIKATSSDVSRTRWSVYLQDMWEVWHSLHLSLGARYDHYSDFGGTFNPRMGFNWEFVRDYSLKFSYGTAYRAPVLGEMDPYTNVLAIGNPNLDPEREQTFETGLVAHPLRGLTTQAVYFHSRIADMIDAVRYCPAPGACPKSEVFPNFKRYENQGTLVTDGVEWEGRYDFQGADHGSYLLANYTYQNPLLNGQTAPDVPHSRVNLIANWRFDRHWNGFANLLYNGAVAGDSSVSPASPDLGSYALLNLSVLNQGQLVNGLDMGLTVYNLLGKQYADPGDFSVPGRTFYGHMSLRF